LFVVESYVVNPTSPTGRRSTSRFINFSFLPRALDEPRRLEHPSELLCSLHPPTVDPNNVFLRGNILGLELLCCLHRLADDLSHISWHFIFWHRFIVVETIYKLCDNKPYIACQTFSFDVTKGLIIGGQFGDILVRQKNEQELELGELLIANTPQGKVLLQVFDLLYGSQLTRGNLELISGMKLEEDESLDILDKKIRNYTLARLKSLAYIKNNNSSSCKTLPKFFTNISEIQPEDVAFITRPPFSLELGNLRSGSKELNVPVAINGRKAFAHHILIAGTTGRGKSVLMTHILKNTLKAEHCALLVLDPHNEYYERLDKQHIHYYSPNPLPGAITLKINLASLTPRDFDGSLEWTGPQRQALSAYYHAYRQDWIRAAIKEQSLKEPFNESTLGVVKRKLMQLLRITTDDADELHCRGIFDLHAGQSTIRDITTALELGKTVIIDTSNFHGSQEILIGSLLAQAMLTRYKNHDAAELATKPIVGIVLEEAPRVLGKEVLEKGPNIFSTIAREGRKFNIGLCAITQLPSLIPREILANMNTKIILGVELKPERQALIESAAQDLSDDDRMIASLDKGEAIITSNFLSFAMPIRIPLPSQNTPKVKHRFGLKQ